MELLLPLFLAAAYIITLVIMLRD